VSNYIITNKQHSIMDLAPLRDVSGHVLTFRPKGTPGDSKEVDEATVDSEIVERVYKAGWIDIKHKAPPQPSVTPGTPPAPPAPVVTPPAPPPPPPPAPTAPVVTPPLHVDPEHSEPVRAPEHVDPEPKK